MHLLHTHPLFASRPEYQVLEFVSIDNDNDNESDNRTMTEQEKNPDKTTVCKVWAYIFACSMTSAIPNMVTNMTMTLHNQAHY